jgi:hypothetical protein
MTRHSPLQQLKEAKQIAIDHGCFVTEKGGKFSVYRKMPMRLVYLGSRSSPEGLRQLVCKVTNFH